MKDVMCDLETLGTVAGCAIVSFGFVPFDEFKVYEDDGFYLPVKIDDWSTPGLTIEGLRKEAGTISWWEGQSEQARAVFTDSAAVLLPQALVRVRSWFTNLGTAPRVWGNGADFDNPIVAAACVAVGMDPKTVWKGYNGRCYRTVKNQFKDIKLERAGTHHNALDDAVSQARHLVDICQKRGWRLA